MSGTLHMQACVAAKNILAAALAANAFVCDGGIHKGRRGRAMPEQYTRQVHVYLDAAPIERAQLLNQPDDWTTRIRVECCARSDAATNLEGDDNADDLAAAVYKALLAHPTLDLPDSVMDLAPLAIAWDTEEGDTQLGVTQLAFDARQRMPAGDISAP